MWYPKHTCSSANIFTPVFLVSCSSVCGVENHPLYESTKLNGVDHPGFDTLRFSYSIQG